MKAKWLCLLSVLAGCGATAEPRAQAPRLAVQAYTEEETELVVVEKARPNTQGEKAADVPEPVRASKKHGHLVDAKSDGKAPVVIVGDDK